MALRVPEGELDCDGALEGEWETGLELLAPHAAPEAARVALYGGRDDEAAGRAALDYRALATFCAAIGGLPFLKERSQRVALVLPNGPCVAAAFVGLCRHCALAPLNEALTRAEFAFEFDDLPAAARPPARRPFFSSAGGGGDGSPRRARRR